LEESKHGSAPTLHDAALAYAGRGVPVFPCEPGAKRPLTRNGHWDATTETQVVRQWWQRWPSANVGVPTGKKSGVVVLDVDVDDGGLESLAKLEYAVAPAPKTARARTGGGGIHIFFRYPRGTEIRNSAGLLGPGLDVRGEGGYVVVPPSRTQRSYQWVDSSALAEASWLIERLTESDEATLF
jgi:putative DNA primase/helicase